MTLPRQVSSPIVRSQEIEARVIADVEDVIEIINDQEQKNFRLGVILIVIAISTWIIGLELVNSVLKGDEFQKPCFLAFLTGACFILNFIPEVIVFLRNLIWSLGKTQSDLSPQLSTSDLILRESFGDNRGPRRIEKSDLELEAPEPLTGWEVFGLALQISIIYFCYNVLVMLALQFTSASNQTLLGSTTTIFTLFVGVYLRVDRFTLKKLICVATSLAGVILINVSESHVEGNDGNKFQPKNPALGNLLALLGAFCYALYLLTMKVRCGTGKKTTNERQLFGFVGLISLFLGIPVLAIAHFTGFEEFLLPPSPGVFAMIITNSVFSVISDYVTILAMLLTSPLVTSLALTSSIPITILVDFIILHITGGDSASLDSNLLLYGFGVLSILMSVILINVNITAENELIEEAIEEAFEDAIRHDEVLSPVLSPYLGSSNLGSYVPSPKVLQAIGSNRLVPSTIFKKLQYVSSPLVPATMNHEESQFSLNADSNEETSLIQNTNHHQNLYTIGTPTEENLINAQANLLVFGGLNHNYHVKLKPSDTKSAFK